MSTGDLSMMPGFTSPFTFFTMMEEYLPAVKAFETGCVECFLKYGESYSRYVESSLKYGERSRWGVVIGRMCRIFPVRGWGWHNCVKYFHWGLVICRLVSDVPMGGLWLAKWCWTFLLRGYHWPFGVKYSHWGVVVGRMGVSNKWNLLLWAHNETLNAVNSLHNNRSSIHKPAEFNPWFFTCPLWYCVYRFPPEER
jgi:hypothetical protein